jgi:hypothetical protein
MSTIAAVIGTLVYSAKMDAATTEIAVIREGIHALGCVICLFGMIICNALWEKNK